MAADKIHLQTHLRCMALELVLGLLPRILEPLETLLLGLLLRISFTLVPHLLQSLPPLRLLQVQPLQRLLLRRHQVALALRQHQYQGRQLQIDLLASRSEKRRQQQLKRHRFGKH
jgi:hypothetical protein